MELFKDALDEDISKIFEVARNKLRSLDLQSKQQKKQIITDLAIKLEGKIAIDSICIEVVNQLRGQVSERFIRECLDQKYKQKIRVDNAKKQIIIKDDLKNNLIKGSDTLAALPPLIHRQKEKEKNELTKEDESKKVVIVDSISGSTSFDELEGEKNARKREENQQLILTKLPAVLDKSPITFTPHTKEQEQRPFSDKSYKQESGECTSCQELYEENCQLKEILQKSGQLIIPAEKLYTKVSTESSTSKIDIESIDNLLPFEFSKTFREIREYMAPLYNMIGDNGLIWFNGKIEIKTGKAVVSGFGKLNTQSENII